MMKLSSAYFKILELTIVRTTNAKTLLYKSDTTNDSIYDYYGQFDKEINQRLSVCVEHHIAVIKFAEAVESMFTYVFLLQFLASAVGICLAGFTFTSAPVGSFEFIFAISLPITLIIQISFYCTFGNEVTLQSSNIGEACYMTEWIACGPLVRKTLFIIMERSKRLLVLTAGKFINLSLFSLAAVFKSAASYAAVLRQITNKE
ncbi:hypothetical protein ILUMI_13215 [Ignelater luminosus]|uniref:Uncharacterized protein n=1 Tax=Ignelater luminosus TaxID=2038154 RepID=A0A8K0CSS5_IGNLU|nr:hypothetical protein ILUMI_13215 [Ignelater luminosus]